MELFDKHSVIVGYDERHMEVDLKPDIWLMKAGYVEDTFQIFPKLNALLGTRYTHVRENTYEYADPGTTEKYRHKITTDIWLPKSTITYQFTEDTSAFVSVNKDYHIPGC
jgi:outer membrane receptor protein involved in Fe transport